MTIKPTIEDLLHHAAADDFGVFARLAFNVLEPDKKFVDGWYLDAIAAALGDVERGTCRRLLITIPPRHMKSLLGSVAFPAWVLGRMPSTKFICVSYGQDLANDLSVKFRRLVQSKLYQRVFSQTARSFTRLQEDDQQTRQGGYRVATSLGGTITGLGADIIVVDDLMKTQDARYPEARQKAKDFVDGTLMSRLNDKATGCLVSIQQRLSEDDIVAHFKAKGGFRELEFPAIAVHEEVIPLTNGRVHHRETGDVLSPEREPLAVLEQYRRDVGNRVFQAQWQQDPTPADSQYIDWAKIQRYDVQPPRERLQRVVQSWDTAASTDPAADYSVGTTWGYDGQSWLLLDIARVRLTYSDLLERARLERNRWRADLILVESACVGLGLIKDLRRDNKCESAREHHAPSCNAIAIKPHVGKHERMMAQVERLYEGFAKFPRQAPWLDDFRHELLAFPEGRHDDQVDSISQFLNHAVARLGPGFFNDNYRPDPPRRP